MRSRPLNSTSTLFVGIALSLGITLGLSACIAPPVSPEPSASASASAPAPSPEPSDEPTTDPTADPGETPADPGTGGPNPDQPIDPDHPWPSDVPRPPGTIVSESSAPNPLGEGSIWNIVFSVNSISGAEAYVTQLRANGWAFLDDREYPARGNGGSVTWAMNNGAMFAELHSDNANATPVVVEFSILGF